MPGDIRKSPRRSVQQGARIVQIDYSAVGPCFIEDITGQGARLRLQAEAVVPDEFILLLSHSGQLQRRCTVAWRSDNAIGVAFLAKPAAAKKPRKVG